ncbi:carboxypeptidase-like regulatory domain-containing protein [Botrimarina mediterranea]|uniref:Carboxypeptidase regulatory-like domain-containing protein n=1 Tax=Botrimarina mediterranea TaxID=2528022 RepID=A0A518K487_9BACT|nr:carboxypeptidase-like regulatory domain-containing protein [Botrimarina mediterranea]QDV72613.1 hypothetical protein Spa11_07930 [Botrimarina mediterranea]
MIHRYSQSLPIALLAFTIGCGDGRPPLYPVSGTVRFTTGEPVRNATIEFVPKASGPSPRGRIDADGNFVLGTYKNDDGAQAGDYHVVVVQALPPDAAANTQMLGDEHAGHGRMQVVALKHASPSTSGVSYTVTPPGAQDAEIVVEAR